MDESEKTPKNGFPPRRTSKKQQKYHFRRGWKVKNEKNGVSAAAESYKTAKTAFPPRRTNKKWQKQSFSRGRNPKTWHFQAQGAFRRLKTQGCLKEKMSWHLFWGYSLSNMSFQYVFLRHSFSIYLFNMSFWNISFRIFLFEYFFSICLFEAFLFEYVFSVCLLRYALKKVLRRPYCDNATCIPFKILTLFLYFWIDSCLKYIVFLRVLKNISYLCRTRTITTFR